MKNGIVLRSLGRDLWPSRDLFSQQDSIERLMDRFLTPWSETNRGAEFNPRADIEETKSHYLVTVDLPGVPKGDVKIEVRDGNLVVEGERKHEEAREEGGQKYFERQYGSFKRVFALPESVEAENIEASFNNGVLEIAVPKSEKVQPRQIKISEGKNRIFSKFTGTKEEN